VVHAPQIHFQLIGFAPKKRERKTEREREREIMQLILVNCASLFDYLQNDSIVRNEHIKQQLGVAN
jgi:hypothetical protein